MNVCPLSVIIVSWNTRDITKNCLDSLFSQPTSVSFDVYVVDNASSDGSPDMVEENFPQVTLIKNQENVGFARANNQVLKEIKTPYALLLNSDTIIPPRDIFTPWIGFMNYHKDVGLSGCRLNFPDGSHQVGDAGYSPSLKTIISHSFFLTRLFGMKGLFVVSPPRDGFLDVDWVSGASMMVRMKALESVGPMDESVFMFAEDIEWGVRFKRCGWRVCYLPFISIVHLQGASSKKQIKPSEFSLLWLRNIKKVYLHLNKSAKPWEFDLFMTIGFLLRSQIYGWIGLTKASQWHIEKAKRMLHYFKGLI